MFEVDSAQHQVKWFHTSKVAFMHKILWLPRYPSPFLMNQLTRFRFIFNSSLNVPTMTWHKFQELNFNIEFGHFSLPSNRHFAADICSTGVAIKRIKHRHFYFQAVYNIWQNFKTRDWSYKDFTVQILRYAIFQAFWLVENY